MSDGVIRRSGVVRGYQGIGGGILDFSALPERQTALGERIEAGVERWPLGIEMGESIAQRASPCIE
jgi:hypothetical protein